MCIENTLNYITRLSLKNKYLMKHLIVCHCNNSQKEVNGGVGNGPSMKKSYKRTNKRLRLSCECTSLYQGGLNKME